MVDMPHTFLLVSERILKTFLPRGWLSQHSPATDHKDDLDLCVQDAQACYLRDHQPGWPPELPQPPLLPPLLPPQGLPAPAGGAPLAIGAVALPELAPVEAEASEPPVWTLDEEPDEEEPEEPSETVMVALPELK